LPFRSLTNGAFSINTMLPFAYETGVSVSSYELQSSISSDAIFGFITGNIASSTTSSFPYYMEYVEILVLQNPVISITGANMTYSVVVEFKNNVTIVPKMSDTLIYNLLKVPMFSTLDSKLLNMGIKNISSKTQERP